MHELDHLVAIFISCIDYMPAQQPYTRLFPGLRLVYLHRKKYLPAEHQGIDNFRSALAPEIVNGGLTGQAVQVIPLVNGIVRKISQPAVNLTFG